MMNLSHRKSNLSIVLIVQKPCLHKVSIHYGCFSYAFILIEGEKYYRLHKNNHYNGNFCI